MLDMEPYTFEGITKLEKAKEAQHDKKPKHANLVVDMNQFYELVGVIVHTGQANAGHYYSFIKNRQ